MRKYHIRSSLSFVKVTLSFATLNMILSLGIIQYHDLSYKIFSGKFELFRRMAVTVQTSCLVTNGFHFSFSIFS